MKYISRLCDLLRIVCAFGYALKRPSITPQFFLANGSSILKKASGLPEPRPQTFECFLPRSCCCFPPHPCFRGHGRVCTPSLPLSCIASNSVGFETAAEALKIRHSNVAESSLKTATVTKNCDHRWLHQCHRCDSCWRRRGKISKWSHNR